LSAPIPLDIANQVRDGVSDPGQIAEGDIGMTGMKGLNCGNDGPVADPQTGANSGGPRPSVPPPQNASANSNAATKVVNLPTIRQVLCTDATKDGAQSPTSELAFDAPVAVRDLAYPDLRALRSEETWALTFEGPLSNDGVGSAIDGPSIRTGEIFVDGAG